MANLPDLSDFSENELNDLIAAAIDRRAELRANREREESVGLYGTTGQDVHNPEHGVIPVPTPNEVEDVGPEHGVDEQDGPAMADRASGV